VKDLPVIRGRNYIAAAVAEGEHEHQDFKYLISDARKIARSISAFANAGGGRLLIGVKDNGTVAGVRSEEDIYVVEQAAGRYCDPPQTVEFTAFRAEAGVVVIRAAIAPAEVRPVRCIDADGRRRAYYRVADENIAAHPLMVRAWRRQAEGGEALCVDSRHTALLTLLGEHSPEGLDAPDIARALGISLRATEQMVVELAAAGIVGFAYRHPRFVITLA